MTVPAIPEIKTIALARIELAETNPNSMDPEKYTLLVRAISEVGFVQPVLVRPVRDRFKLIDGEHRVRAARELGMEYVPCVIGTGDLVNDEQAAVTQIAMGRLRGDLDLAAVGRTMEGLLSSGWSMPELTLTGFSEDEIADLLEAARSATEDVLAGSDTTLPDTSDIPLRPFVLEITFASRAEYTKARKGLKRAAGSGGELSDGLLKLLGEDHA
jgi:ParB-like chromosome segregation protein Spo0J